MNVVQSSSPTLGTVPREQKTPAPPKDRANSSYARILKSSALIGGSSAVTIAIGIIRTKVIALLLGPGGVGLMGLYTSIAELAQSIATLGINNSGVRQIAEAVGSGDSARVGRTAAVLRRISIVLGIIGAALLALFSRQVSLLTFGTDRHQAAVALLSLAVLFGAITAGRSALIQGLRRIGDLARLGILGALFGTLVSIPVIYFLREDGVVPALVLVAAIASLTAWWYSRRVQIDVTQVSAGQVRREVAALLKLGFAFAASALLTMGAAYAIRMIIARGLGLEAAGLYQAAWVLGGLYVGFILQAMGADFYPRLTAISNDDDACNCLVNEQMQASLLLATPGVLATITFAPIVIALFYSNRFADAIEPLRWICLGMSLRVIAWPMGFIILAKGMQSVFFWTEIAATVVHVGLAAVLVNYFGVSGACMAFCGLYLWHGLLIYVIVRRSTGFRLSVANKRMGVITLSSIGLVFCAFQIFPFGVAVALGAVAVIASGILSTRVVLTLVPFERIPPRVLWLAAALRLVPRAPGT